MTAAANAVGEKKARRFSSTTIATMTPSLMTNPPSATAESATGEILAARESDQPWTAKFAKTMATPMAADQPASQPPATAPMRSVAATAGGPNGTTRRTNSRSGSVCTLPLAEPQVHQIRPADRAGDHPDREEHRLGSQQPIDQPPESSPDG